VPPQKNQITKTKQQKNNPSLTTMITLTTNFKFQITIPTRQQSQPNNKALMKPGTTIYPNHGEAFLADD